MTTLDDDLAFGNIQEADFDDVPFENPTDPDYYMVIRRFRNGTVEGVTRPVRHMERDLMRRRYENCGAINPRPSETLEEPTEEDKAARRDADRRRAAYRAKQGVRFCCKQIAADRLLTLTYRANVTDRERVADDFTRFVRLLRKSLGDQPWSYVAVLEKQDRGSYHLHLAVTGWQRIKVIRRCWYRAIGGNGDETGEATPGQVDVTSPKGKAGKGGAGRQWRSESLAGYISKYMEKTFMDADESEKRRYWHSKGIEKPQKERIWLGAVDIAGAVGESVRVLQTFYGLVGAQFQVWLSSDHTTFWVSGKTSVEVSFEDCRDVTVGAADSGDGVEVLAF